MRPVAGFACAAVMAVAAAGVSGRAAAYAELVESHTFTAATVRGGTLEQFGGARPAALAGACAAVVGDSTAIWWNPGGLARIEGYDTMIEGGAIGVENGSAVLRYSAAHPIGPVVIGLGLNLSSYPDYYVRNESGEDLKLITTGDSVVSLGCGFRHPLWGGRQAWSGIVLDWLSEAAMQMAILTVSAGTQVKLDAPVTLGVVIEHLAPAVGGYALPARVRLGMEWLPVRWVGVLGETGVGLADGTWSVAFGLEPRLAFLSLRAGLRYQMLPAAAPDEPFMLSLGVGVKLGNMDLDFGLGPQGSAGNVMGFSLSYHQPPLGRWLPANK